MKEGCCALWTRRGGRFVVLLLGAWLPLVALASPSGETVLADVRLSAAGTVCPGQSLTVTWDSLPPGTEEFELLLRCESPVPITLRLTESHEPSLTAIPWRVPGLPTSRARILIRRGRKGRESLWAQSAPFEIVDSGEGTATHITLRRGEYWLTEAHSFQFGAHRPEISAGVGDRREDSAEESSVSQEVLHRSPAGASGSPPPSPDAVPRRARVAPNRETRPLSLRI